MVKRFEELEVWKNARFLALRIYFLINTTNIKKDFSLSDQMKRSAGSVMDNIAEGFDRNGSKEFIQFLSIAKGSCAEVRSQLYRASDQKFMEPATFEELLDLTDKISSQIQKLINYLRHSNIKGSKYL
ncbi:MAG: hypothetical protein KIPDCIKN_03862 [Haliscomenobacter sp.]|jgi:four helix bundle protein|nr:hypothetical protein [Haliscomenobacter sp.]